MHLQGEQRNWRPRLGFFSPGRACLWPEMQCNPTLDEVRNPSISWSPSRVWIGALLLRCCRERFSCLLEKAHKGQPLLAGSSGLEKTRAVHAAKPSFSSTRVPLELRETGMVAKLDATAVYFCCPRLSSTLRLKGLQMENPAQRNLGSVGWQQTARDRPVSLPNADSSQIFSSTTHPAAEESRTRPRPGSPLALGLWPIWPFGDGGDGRVNQPRGPSLWRIQGHPAMGS